MTFQPKIITFNCGKLPLRLKTSSYDILVTNICKKRSAQKKKVSENNQQLCKEKNIHYTGRNITINTKHLSSWLLHLNKSGKKIFLNDFSLLLSNILISNILQWSSTLHSPSDGHYVHMLEDLKTKPVHNMKCIKSLVVIHKHNANTIFVANLNIIYLTKKLWSCRNIYGEYGYSHYYDAKTNINFPVDQFLINHFMQLVTFCIPWKHQKARGFLIF